MHIGLKIKLLRKKRNLSKKYLAEAIGKDEPLMSHIERTGKIHYHTLKDICLALNTTIDELENIKYLINEKQ